MANAKFPRTRALLMPCIRELNSLKISLYKLLFEFRVKFGWHSVQVKKVQHIIKDVEYEKQKLIALARKTTS